MKTRKQWTWNDFLFVLLMAAVVVVLISTTGCLSPTENTLRFEPTQPVKQDADAVNTFAQGTSQATPANAGFAKFTKAIATYCGQPDTPLDVQPLIQAYWDEWDTLRKQNESYKLTRDMGIQSTLNVVQQLQLIVQEISINKDRKITADDILPRMGAIVSGIEMWLDVMGKVVIPPDANTTNEVSQILDKFKQALIDANASAAKRPTGTDVVYEMNTQLQAGSESAKDILGTIQGIAEDWGLGNTLTGLLGAAGIGGVALRGRSKIKKTTAAAKTELEEKEDEISELKSESEKQIAELKSESEKQIAKLQGENDSLYDQVTALSQKLAESPSTLSLASAAVGAVLPHEGAILT